MKKNVKDFLKNMEGFSNDDEELTDFEPNQTQKMHTVPIPPPNPGVVVPKVEKLVVDQLRKTSGVFACTACIPAIAESLHQGLGLWSRATAGPLPALPPSRVHPVHVSGPVVGRTVRAVARW